MLRGLYSAATALDAASQKQETVAGNLANSTVPGYRKRDITFESFDRIVNQTQQETGDIVGTSRAKEFFDFTPGGIQFTGNPLDLALQSDGFFVLQGPNGPLYTRNGTFRVTPQGQVLSRGGNYPLVGTLGPVQVPPGTLELSISSDGVITADGANAGQVRRVRFQNPSQLLPAGPTLFKAPPQQAPGQQAPVPGQQAQNGPGLQESTEGVLQGARESSNVNPAQALVDLVIGTRYFEASQRVLRAIAESIQLNTRPQT